MYLANHHCPYKLTALLLGNQLYSSQWWQGTIWKSFYWSARARFLLRYVEVH